MSGFPCEIGGIQTRFHFITQEQTVQKLHLLMEMTVKHAQHYVPACAGKMLETLNHEHMSADSKPVRRTNYQGLSLGSTVPGDDQKGQLIKEIH